MSFIGDITTIVEIRIKHFTNVMSDIESDILNR
jgi:hypothetical protein